MGQEPSKISEMNLQLALNLTLCLRVIFSKNRLSL
jgi:hypothetical protein